MAAGSTDRARLLPRRRGFRARVHGFDREDASAFSKRALLVSLVLHGALLGAFGLTNAIAGSSGSPASSATLLFARADDIADDIVDAQNDPVLAQPAEGERWDEELLGELWEPELVEAPELRELPAEASFDALPLSTEADWPLAAAFLRKADEADSDESTDPEQAVVEGLAAEELVDAEAPTSEIEHESPPILVSAPPPAYPPLAVRMGWEGSVSCRVRVATDGSVERASVDTSSGHEVLDQAALEAIRQWRFETRSTPLDFVHQVTFRLER